MIYSEKYKFIYFSIPKTGSTTISSILIKDYKAVAHYDRHDNRIPLHAKDYFKFSTVRNPYERAISGYTHVTSKLNVNVPEVFEHFHLISMTDYLTQELAIEKWATAHDNYKNMMTKRRGPGINIHLLRLENLETDFSKLYFVKNKIKLDKQNATTMFPSKQIMDQIVKYVKVNYRKDFENFGYDININPYRKTPLFC